MTAKWKKEAGTLMLKPCGARNNFNSTLNEIGNQIFLQVECAAEHPSSQLSLTFSAGAINGLSPLQPLIP
jgi:hypothetical protein